MPVFSRFLEAQVFESEEVAVSRPLPAPLPGAFARFAETHVKFDTPNNFVKNVQNNDTNKKFAFLFLAQ